MAQLQRGLGGQLFRLAVTAGKRIKTSAPIRRGDYSAAHQAIEALRRQSKQKGKLVFGPRVHLSPEAFRDCLEALRQVYGQEEE